MASTGFLHTGGGSSVLNYGLKLKVPRESIEVDGITVNLEGLFESISGFGIVYVAPNGNDDNSGSIVSPLASLVRAIELAPYGGTIEVINSSLASSNGAEQYLLTADGNTFMTALGEPITLALNDGTGTLITKSVTIKAIGSHLGRIAVVGTTVDIMASSVLSITLDDASLYGNIFTCESLELTNNSFAAVNINRYVTFGAFQEFVFEDGVFSTAVYDNDAVIILEAGSIVQGRVGKHLYNTNVV